MTGADLAQYWPVFPVAFGVATVAISAGVGGGLFFVPIFTIALGLDIKAAIGTAIVAQLVGAFGGTMAHTWRRTVDWKYAGMLALVGAPAVALGFLLNQVIDALALRIIFAGVLIAVAAIVWRQQVESSEERNHLEADEECEGDLRERSDRAGTSYVYCVRNRVLGMGAGMFAGVCVGLVGLGGGEINTPSLRGSCGMHIRIAIATSTAIMVGTGIVAATIRIPSATIVWPIALIASAGTLLGSQVGARVASTMSASALRLAVVAVFFTVAVLMLVQATTL